MSKRKALDRGPDIGTRHEDMPVDRAIAFSARLRSINRQFADWVQQQAEECPNELWLDGAEAYQRYIRHLLADFEDLIGGAAREGSPADVAPSNLFGTPCAGAAAAAAGGGKAARTSGPSTGKKSVSWSETPVDLGPAAAGGSGTPNPHTANAGHTPAPAGFGARGGGGAGAQQQHDHGAASPLPTPQFRLTPGGATPAGDASFSNGVAHAMKRAAAAANTNTNTNTAAAATTSTTPADGASGSGGGGFSFGVVGAPGAAASGGGGGGGFSFGTTPSGQAGGSGGATPPAVGSTLGFGFGTPAGISAAGSSAAGAASSSAPAFSFGTTPPADASSAPAAITFGAPAGSSGGGGGGGGGGASDATPAHKPTFAFGAPASNGAAAATTTSTQPRFGFGAVASTGPSGGGGGGTAGFSFGAASSAAGASSSSAAFGFAAAGSAGTTPGGMFQFLAPSAAAAANGDDDGAGAGEEAAPVEEATEVQVDASAWNVVFNEKGKLFVRVDGAWDGRGVGMVSLRQPTQGPAASKTYLMFTTLKGKQLVAHELKPNSSLMRFDNTKTACRMSLTTIEYELPPASSEATAAPAKQTYKLEVCLLRFGKEETVDRLAAAIEEHKPKE